MKTAFLLRGSQCFGDLLMISWTPKQIKEKLGYEHLTVATWKRNQCIWDNNPYIDEYLTLDDIKETNLAEQLDIWKKKYTKFFDFRYSVELKYLRNSGDNILTIEQRRELAQGQNYYEHALQDHGLVGAKAEIYFSDQETKLITKLQDQKKFKRICWQITGTGRNKLLVFLPAYIHEVMKKYPDTEHYLVGDQKSDIGIHSEKLIDMRGKWTPRDTMVFSNTFDLIVAPESFMIHVAGALDIPNICFYSHSAPENLTKHFRNSYAVVPSCECSPCYLILKDFRQYINLKERKKAREQEQWCLLREKKDHFRGIGFRCTVQIDHKKVIEKISAFIEV